MPLGRNDLKEMKKSRDVEGLLCALDTGDIKETREAVCILGKLRSRKAIMPLIGLLEIDDVQIRANSAWALGEIGDMRAVLPLIGLLNDPSENVRVYAAWALGKIGDKRAIPSLNAAVKNGSSELRKHAKEAIARIDQTKHNIQHEDNDNRSNVVNEILTSGSIDLPLVTLNAPLDILACNYVSRVEGKPEEGRLKFSEDVAIEDTISKGEKNRRRVILGLKNDFDGLVSIDVLFRYVDINRHTSSVWLQMTSAGESTVQPPIQNRNDILKDRDFDRDSEEQIAEGQIEETGGGFHRDIKRYKIKSERGQSIEQEHYDIPEYQETEYQQAEEYKKERIDEDYIENKVTNKKETTASSASAAVPSDRIQHPKLKANEDIHAKQQSSLKPSSNFESEKVIEVKQVSVQAGKTEASIDSAVRLLSDIGMSGMTEAASTVTQLGGQEAESLQSRLRTLPIDQIPDEIVNLGDHIVSIEVKLHGKGQSGEMEGKMQMYFSKNVALDIANELLCNAPDALIKEFTEDIISTLKETANIFGGQYISAISEYIEISILLEAPVFNTGTSSQLAESLMKDISGKIEFALATDLTFGNNKTGRLIMLLDPKSYDLIITKLF